jgi:hypothetical protein
MEGTRKEPWKKKAPKGTSGTKLTPKSKARAKALARAAGRPYPNLVDNMRVAKEQKASTGKRRRA